MDLQYFNALVIETFVHVQEKVIGIADNYMTYRW